MLSGISNNTEETPKPSRLERAMKIFDVLQNTGEIGMGAYDLKLKRDKLNLLKDSAKKNGGVKTDTLFKAEYQTDPDNPTWENK